MLVSLFSPLPIIAAGVVSFLLGWLWYSKAMFMNWWLEGMHTSVEEMPKRTSLYIFQSMIYMFLVGTVMCALLAFLIDFMLLDTLKEAVSLSVVFALGFIGLRNFQEMLVSTPEKFWSFRAQKRFFVSTGYYVVMFTVATIVMYYVQTWFGA